MRCYKKLKYAQQQMEILMLCPYIALIYFKKEKIVPIALTRIAIPLILVRNWQFLVFELLTKLIL